MPNIIGGTTSVSIDGKVVSFKSDCMIYPQRNRHTRVTTEGGAQGVTSEPVSPRIKMKITDPGDLDIAALFSSTPKTIQIVSNNGRVWTGDGCLAEGDVSLATKENEIDIEFTCDDITEKDAA